MTKLISGLLASALVHARDQLRGTEVRQHVAVRDCLRARGFAEPKRGLIVAACECE